MHPLSVSVQPLADSHVANVVAHKRIFRRHFAASGYFHFAVKLTQAEKASGVKLHSYGQQLNLVAVDKKGNISAGSQLTLYDDAQVSMRHSEGLHVLWLAQPYRAAAPGDTVPDTVPVALRDENLSKSISRPLKKPVEVLRFNLQQAGLFNLSTKAPVILRKGIPGLDESLLVYETAMRDSVFLPAGESYLEFESINGQPLRDTLYLHKAPFSALEEGLGKALSLYPGQARLYSFELDNAQGVERQIGVGVKASIDIAQCTLYNAQAQVLGRGVTQKHRLQAGRYYLAVNLPVDTPSMVSVQPALVGLDKPSQGPPQAVMLEYQQLISQKTQ
ncbi:hypothetical protein MNBD_GAMMA10-1369 [hydrothermal vent metagenome]|uniref:Uncharacterized protein n=1 Tax=hydrothermal vent metagenome TaxID=652676 RepID=A0A3B0YDA1_9ZZZZ